MGVCSFASFSGFSVVAPSKHMERGKGLSCTLFFSEQVAIYGNFTMPKDKLLRFFFSLSSVSDEINSRDTLSRELVRTKTSSEARRKK